MRFSVPRGGINDNIAASLIVPLGISSLSLQIVNLVLVDGAADKNLALVMAGDITTVLALCLVWFNVQGRSSTLLIVAACATSLLGYFFFR